MKSKSIRLCLAILILVFGPGSAMADADQVPHIGKTLSVMSLNLAHGRKQSLNQLLVSKKRTRQNLGEIAKVFMRTQVDVIALQEADGPSRWSGKFDHVALLSSESALPATVHSEHAQNWLYSYGTALISKTAFRDEVHYTFNPTLPTTNKGFTLGQIAWQAGTTEDVLLIDIVSVHLDFSRKAVREQQIDEMASVLEQRKNPIIVMGDFNSDWLSEEQVVRELAKQASLHAYQPGRTDLGTYPSSGRRLDWILISSQLEFSGYQTLADTLSDHLAVVAHIRIK